MFVDKGTQLGWVRWWYLSAILPFLRCVQQKLSTTTTLASAATVLAVVSPNHELPSHSGLPAPVGFRRKSPLPLALVFSFGRVPQSHISKLDLSDFVIQSFIVLLTQALSRVTKLSVP